MKGLQRQDFSIRLCRLALWAIALSCIAPLAQADNIINPVAGTTTEVRTLQDGLLRRDLLVIAPRQAQGLRPALVLLSRLLKTTPTVMGFRTIAGTITHRKP